MSTLPTPPVYFASTDLITGAVAAQNLLTIENPIIATPPPSTPAVNVVIHRVTARGICAAISTTAFLYRLRRTTTIPSGGVVLTAQKRRSADPAPQAVLRLAATATGAAGTIAAEAAGFVITAAGQFLPPDSDLMGAVQPDHRCIILAPGEGLLISADINTVDWSHWAEIEWHEGGPLMRVQGP